MESYTADNRFDDAHACEPYPGPGTEGWSSLEEAGIGPEYPDSRLRGTVMPSGVSGMDNSARLTGDAGDQDTTY